MNKKVISSIGVIMVLLILVVPTAFAANDFNPFHIITSEQGNTVTQSISDAFSIIVGDKATVQHKILGTTIVMGNSVEVANDIDGDLIALGKDIMISGKVDGNLYAAGNDVSIKGSVAKDAFLFGNRVSLEKESIMGRDATLFASTVNAFGEVKRDGVVYAENCNLYGNIGRNMSAGGEEISVANGAKIAGDFAYQSKNDAKIENGAKISGNVQKNEVEKKPVKAPSPFKRVWGILFILGVAAVFWAVLLLIAPRLLDKFAALLADKPGSAAGFGAIVLVTVPIAAIILLCTVVGIPLSIILGATYAVLLYLAFFISAGAFGIVMFKNVFQTGDLHKNIWYVLSGVFVVKLLTMLPFIGWLISLASVVFGLGLVLLLLVDFRKKQIG